MDHHYPRIESSSSSPNPSNPPTPYSTASGGMPVAAPPQPWILPRDNEQSHGWGMFPPRPEAQPVSLPPIKQVFPELELNIRGVNLWELAESGAIRFVQPGHPAFDQKRRFVEEYQKNEAWMSHRRLPRVHRGPRHRVHHFNRPSPPTPVIPDRWIPVAERMASPGSPYSLPVPIEIQNISSPRVALPSLRTAMNFDNESLNSRTSSRSHSRDFGRTFSQDYTQYSPQSQYQSQPSSPGQQPYHRASFSTGGYHSPNYTETNRTNRFGELGTMAGESKPRKRRGNLPKETTDKLRFWFGVHLHHPYPTEDEKQELVRQTGLQMNQISNWFINARRRQLPGMLKQERREAEARARAAAAAAAATTATNHEDQTANPTSLVSTAHTGAGSEEVPQHRPGGNLAQGSV